MADDPASGPPPIFLLSFRHRDELAGAAERAGWKAIAARRSEGVERRFVASGASVAVIDARGAFDEGLAAVRLLSDAVEANASALLVLLSRGHVPLLSTVLAAGATHYLASPFGDAELGEALRFAARHGERLAGGRRAASGRAELVAAESETWAWRPGEATVALSPALVARLGIDGGEGAAPRVARRDGPCRSPRRARCGGAPRDGRHRHRLRPCRSGGRTRGASPPP